MIKGIGIDLTEISRIIELEKKYDYFLDKILNDDEKEQYFHFSDKRKYEYLAARYSGKESYSKALGTGIGKNFSFKDISILSDELGNPFIKTDRILDNVHISISHTDNLVITQVIIEEL